MCGIVGYLGKANGVEVILEGLTRLEYRGYDSAGISLIDQEANVFHERAVGKLEKLKQKLANKKFEANIAIGHTRWATHGVVNEENAHPLTRGDLNLVHNGIIENAEELRQELSQEGETFFSDTDTEVFVVLVERFKKQGCSFINSVSKALRKIKGNSSFVIFDATENKLVGLKRGAPLVIGENHESSELFISSDPYALIGFCEDIYFPEDEVLCLLEESKLSFLEVDGSESKRFLKKSQATSLGIHDKGDFEHFMLKEIHEQPNLIKGIYQFYQKNEIYKKELEKVSSKIQKRIYIVACGTAWHAGLIIKDFFERVNRIPCLVELASEFRYRDPIFEKNDVALFISQSGETADTLAAQKLCKEKGVFTFSLVNVEGSTLYRECDSNLLINAGSEIGVASTKAFTQMALTGYLLSLYKAKSFEEEVKSQNLMDLADGVESLLNQSHKIREIAESVYNKKGFLFTARGRYFPIALEGALKLKEIAYVHAEGYAAGELKHGPIALIDEEMVNIAVVAPDLYDKTLSNLSEVKARRGIVVGVGPEEDKNLKNKCDYFFGVNLESQRDLDPLLVNVFMQLFSYYLAHFKGTDIDKPRNLAKSVTVE